MLMQESCINWQLLVADGPSSAETIAQKMWFVFQKVLVASSLVSLIFFPNHLKQKHCDWRTSVLCTDAQTLGQIDNAPSYATCNNELYDIAFHSGSDCLDTDY